MFFLNTIKSKIIFFTITLSLAFSIMLCGVVYTNYSRLLKSHMVEVTSANLRLVMDSLDEDLLQVKSLMEWGTINSRLQTILTYHEINGQNGPEVMSFIELFTNMINSSVSDDIIEKVVIAGNDGISLQMGRINGSVYDVDICRESSWFQERYKAPGITWSGIEENRFQYPIAEYIIPVVRPVYHYAKHKDVGFVMIGINGNIPYQYIRDYSNYEDSDVFICNAEGQIIAHTEPALIGASLNREDSILDLIGGYAGGQTEGSVWWRENGINKTAVYYRSPVTGWYVVQTLSDRQFYEQRAVIIRLLIFIIIGILTVAVFLSLVLNYYINKPIKQIVNKIEDISRGDFSTVQAIESNDEIGRIGIGINRMSENIVGLMDKSVEAEKNKRNLELKVLQAQINPHFLYNTLNSIKWMATIQKASGIGEMVSALSRLLRNMAKGVSDCISIKEELALVQDYITIQRYRYGESFKVDYEIDEALLDYKIPKFTMQPIIENAVFHGLEPKSGIGMILIKVTAEGSNILISITDNGIGMTVTEIERVLKTELQERKDSMNGLGVKNVDERIKLIMGTGYGVEIKSIYGEYTTVTIRIPMIR